MVNRISFWDRIILMRYILLTILILLLPSVSTPATTLPEIVESKCLGETNVNINGITIPCAYKDYAIVFDTTKHWAEAMATAIEIGAKTQRVGAVVLIGNKYDDGYKKARELIYGLPIPIELNSLTLKRGI